MNTENNSSGNESEVVSRQNESKKRKKYGRMRDVMKKIRLQSHEVGANCNCRKQCFQNVPEEARKTILKNFNAMTSINDQYSYLCGLITVLLIRRRRHRKDEDVANLRSSAYSYRVRFRTDNSLQEINICTQAFMSVHGIKKKKLEILQNSLKMTGVAPKDKRGENKTHPRKFDAHVLAAIYEHIKSFNGRKSHYSVKDSIKLFLPEDLNIKKMFKMFCELNPSMKVSYESYRTVFNTKFNIAFGYPRTDTCCSCDQFLIKIKSLQSDVLKSMDIAQKERFQKEIRHITIQNDVHKRKAEVFYSRKRAAKKRSRTSVTHEAICLDFGQNLSVPNTTTNDVYYKSQLNVYAWQKGKRRCMLNAE
ncbi:unnamed protein product [Acanthoscelides obtectus]|uniref:Uncharacterized protein n=1 Tax=Acanthoscelides obtectus TaxID=200917 RepID=A0A9P0K038_ACAOB|nr:unnamed protein product [Acanthoscelides obtectus]CAK1660372.1 hypothetical protein AOBTE_LOCUS22027 [Acanthoscelides obtectus]